MLFKDLYKKCSNYQKIAENSLPTDLTVSKMSVVENSDPVLKQLSEIKSFDERIEFADKNFVEKLGEGSARAVYKLDDDLIIKIAFNDKGIAQNLVEADPKGQRECTNNVLVADAKGKWIIIKFTEDMSKEDFKKITGLSFDSFMNALFYKFNNESDQWSEPRDYKKIQENQLFKCIAGLVFDKDLLLGDLEKPTSYGILDGKIVLRDTGLDKKTYDKYYASSRSSSSTPPKTSE